MIPEFLTIYIGCDHVQDLGRSFWMTVDSSMFIHTMESESRGDVLGWTGPWVTLLHMTTAIIVFKPTS